MKKFWSLFLAFALSLTLMACSDQPANNTAGNNTPPVQTTETQPAKESSDENAHPPAAPEDSTVAVDTASQSTADEEAPTDDSAAEIAPSEDAASTAKPEPDPEPTPQPAYAPYIGNKNTKKFHYASCSSVDQMKSSNKVEIWDRSSAISGGYDPCKRCNP